MASLAPNIDHNSNANNATSHLHSLAFGPAYITT